MPDRRQRTTPAKVNLFLDVLCRRADGYHEIDTVFAPLAEPADVITLATRPTPGIDIVCDNPDVPLDERNLCRLAAERFAARTGYRAAWQVRIAKRIPVAAGLGGGSSDAAALLMLLNQLVERPLANAELRALAVGIGADVPFFLAPQLARATGVGERLSALRSALRLPLVLVSPGFPTRARWAYENHERAPRPALPPVAGLVDALERGDVAGVAEHTGNALEPALLDKFPVLGMIRDGLLACGCLAAHVSGSGPTMFGICRTAADAKTAETALAREFAGAFRAWTCVADFAGP